MRLAPIVRLRLPALFLVLLMTAPVWSAGPPLLSTSPPYGLENGVANFGGTVDANESPTVAYFKYGTSTNFGMATSPVQIDSGTAEPGWGADGFLSGVRYYYRLVATNGFGKSETSPESFVYPNSRPTISAVPDRTIGLGQSTRPLGFQVADFDTPASLLTLEGHSSDTNLVPDANIVFGGSDGDRTVTVTAVPALKGTTTITLTVLDPDGGSALESFQLTAAEFASPNVIANASGSAAVGDYDNDGYLDLFFQQSGTILKNLANRAFTNLNSGLSRSTASGESAAGDYDRDGWLDLARADSERIGGRITPTLLRNNGDHTFSTNTTSGLIPVGYGSTAWGDYDNDGDPDLLLTGSTNTSLVGRSISRLYRNNADGTFALTPITLPGVEDSTLSWADFDDDGNLDFFVGGYTNSQLRSMSRIYRNEGNGAFADLGLALPGIAQGAQAWGDYDNDGDLDFVLVGKTNSTGSIRGIARVYRNEGGGNFVDIGAGLPGLSYATAMWGDFDNDGDHDLLVSGQLDNSSSLVTRVYVNNGNGTFTNLNAPLTGLFNGAVEWGDFDNDGRLDILLHSSDSPARIYWNYLDKTNTPPAAPSYLNTLVSEASVTLSWQAAVDPDQTNSLSYNLRVGTAPGLGDVVAPAADTQTGQRRSARMGNAGLRTSWTLRRLPVGVFYWSVQAIDHAYAGSPFASEGTFTITNSPPLVETKPAINPSATGALALGRVDPRGVETTYHFEYGTTTSYGSSTPPVVVPGGTIWVDVEQVLTGLAPSTTYHFRLVASNPDGIATGDDLSFATAAAALFSEIPVPFPLWRQPILSIADYNNDGNLDVIISGFPINTSPQATLVFDNRQGRFSTSTVQLPFFRDVEPVWGDFDHDSWLDVAGVAATNFNRGISLYRNLSGGAFTLAPQIWIPGYDSSPVNEIAWADPDNDGDLDLSSARHQAFDIKPFLRNDGGGGWGLPTTDYAALRGTALEWGDFDNDGDFDLLMAGFTNFNAATPLTRIFRNDGGFQFTDLAAGLPGVNGRARWGDYDNDGDLDIALAGFTNSASLETIARIYRNDGAAGFVDLGALLNSTNATAVTWGDYDNDGKLDLLVNNTTRLSLYHNEGTDQFLEIDAGLPNATSIDSWWADLDGDSSLDLLLVLHPAAGSLPSIMKFYRNNSLPRNSVPSAPTGLMALSGGTTATLSWNAAQDANQSAGLGYNLRLGTTPGGSEMVSPMSDPVTGVRRLAQQGNAGQRLSWTIKDLPPGTYYWDVQAIDHSLAGSPFSAESSFAISAMGSPELRILSLRMVDPTGVELTVQGPVRGRAQLEKSYFFGDWDPVDPQPLYLGNGTNSFTAPFDGHPWNFFRARLLP